MSEARSSPVLYPVAPEQAQVILPSGPQQPQATTQQPQPPPQQRVHVIKKNIYLMTSSPGNSGTNGGGGTTNPMVMHIFLSNFKHLIKNCFVCECLIYLLRGHCQGPCYWSMHSMQGGDMLNVHAYVPFSQHIFNFQINNLNRQIIMQPKSIVAGGNITTAVCGPQTASIVAVTENSDELQYFPRATKKLTVQGATNSTPASLGDAVNVVFRAPVVSSSSNQSMRPPPPPPPKIKGHSEEPSSSIPDLGKFYHSKFYLSNSMAIFLCLLFLSLAKYRELSLYG